MVSVAVIDFETSSLLPNRKATEVGVVLLDSNLVAISEFETLVNPELRADKSSLGISKLTQALVDCAPKFSEIWPTLHPFVAGKLLVAHHAEFDKTVLLNELRSMGQIVFSLPTVCTLEWSRRIFGSSLKNFTLEDVCEFLEIPLLNSHEALSDAKATAKVFKALYERSPELRDFCSEAQSQIPILEAPSYAGESPIVRPKLDVQDRKESELRQIFDEIRSNQKLKMVVITGKIHEESKFESLCAKAGFPRKQSPVTAGTAFLVVGEAPGQGKIADAIYYGRPILTLNDANKVLNGLISGSL